MAIREFIITAQEVLADQKKFYASTAKINGNWFKVKFTRDCNLSPKSKGMYHLSVDDADISIEKGRKYTKKDGTTGLSNDTIWIKKVVSLTMFTQEEYEERRVSDIKSVFEPNDEEIPF